VLRNKIARQYKHYEDSDLGCESAAEIKLRNDAMKRIAFMKQYLIKNTFHSSI
jgi:hypothetical protein